MSTTTTPHGASLDPQPSGTRATQRFVMNCPPSGADAAAELPQGFLEFLRPLHERFSPWQQELLSKRKSMLAAAHQGHPPSHLPAGEAQRQLWKLEVPAWCQDQRNQMTGPADDAELVVKMLNSGAPGVMLDLEDSAANEWTHQRNGVRNILAALDGTLTYEDKKRGRTVGIEPSKTVLWLRVRGLHLHQGGIFGSQPLSASLFDTALLAHQIELDRLKHPPCFYIPKSESAEEALWWSALFDALEDKRGWARGTIRCMALIESHACAYQMEEFLFNLRGHIVGLNLGRWDYMASLIHYNLKNPEWVLPDRNTIPHDVAFFQSLRELLPELCHKHRALAIGGMTALYPSRDDAELNARALAVLEKDKKNEANQGFDGAWTGHPDQNAIAVAQFPVPNQITFRHSGPRYPNLRPVPTSVGQRTVSGTRAAVRTVIRYRNGVLNGKGASLLDGYMEDLATDRIYRLMIAQRMEHWRVASIVDENGKAVPHTKEFISQLFDEELTKLLANPGRDLGTPETFRLARQWSEDLVESGEFNPI